MITPDPNLQVKDLSAFTQGWNSRDVQAIKALYTNDARIFSEAEARNMENQSAVNVNVSEDLLTSLLKAMPEGYQIRVVGDPMMIYDKLVAFTYRLEGPTEGYNAAGLLRYESDKIYQHVFFVSGTLTKNNAPASVPALDSTVSQMMDAWNKSDVKAATSLYASDALILSDEDLAQVQWRDFSFPPSLAQLLSQFSGWKPELISSPLQLGDMVLFAWRWNIRDYPVGYGVRLVRVQNGMITTDIRYAIRPWEAQGKEFSSGG